ncbi:MAG: hypothetical protein WBY94_17400 [Polyangiaceae bacterium]
MKRDWQIAALLYLLVVLQPACGSQNTTSKDSAGGSNAPATGGSSSGDEGQTGSGGSTSSGSGVPAGPSSSGPAGSGSGGSGTALSSGSSGASGASSSASGGPGTSSPSGSGSGAGGLDGGGSGSGSGSGPKDAAAPEGGSGPPAGSSSSGADIGDGGPVRYVFSTFGTRSNTANASKLLIYTSTDGLNFTLFSATGGYAGPTGTLRDPSIMKFSDGRYYITFTTPPDAGCCGPEASFSIASSPDLATWTTLTTINSGLTGTTNTWAPEWFKDTDGSIHILVNIDTTASAFQTYDFKATDSTLKSFSGPTPIGITGGYIDTFVLVVGGVYHAFSKNTAENEIEHATASALLGPWTFVGKADWAGWGAHKEAPAVFQLPNGTWRIFMDGGSQGGESYSDSTDGFMTWTPVKSLPTISALVSHGTVIK